MEDNKNEGELHNRLSILGVDISEQTRLKNLYKKSDFIWHKEINNNTSFRVSMICIVVGFPVFLYTANNSDYGLLGAIAVLVLSFLSFFLEGRHERKLAQYHSSTKELKIKLQEEEQKIIIKLKEVFDNYLKNYEKESLFKFSQMLDEASKIVFETEFMDIGHYKKILSTKIAKATVSSIEEYVSEFNSEEGLGGKEILPPESFFSTPRKIDWDTLNEAKKLHGDLGEMFVYDLEINYLTKAGRSDLAEKVKHVASEGDGHGYDIKSFYVDGREKFIEVKATNASSGSTFNMSKNEFNFLKTHLNNAVVYHVHNVNNERETTVVIYPASSVVNSPDISPSGYVVKM
jgi:Domain of unknown function (DUF3883)